MKIIDNDIELQKKQLKGIYNKDKPVNWRIIGMEFIKEKINQYLEDKDAK